MPTVTGEVRPKWVIIYETLNEEEPFTNWLNNLHDAIGRKRILARVARLEKAYWQEYLNREEVQND
jgi:hypothetical protein